MPLLSERRTRSREGGPVQRISGFCRCVRRDDPSRPDFTNQQVIPKRAFAEVANVAKAAPLAIVPLTRSFADQPRHHIRNISVIEREGGDDVRQRAGR